MTTGLGPNPFRRKKPPGEKLLVTPAVAERPPLVPPIVKVEEPTLPPIPPEGVTYPLNGITHTILEDFEYVTQERGLPIRKLKSKDYIEYAGGIEIGRWDSKTGEFVPRVKVPEKEWWLKDVWDAFYLGAREMGQSSKQYFLSAIPNLLWAEAPIPKDATPQQLSVIQGTNRKSAELRDYFRKIYRESERQYQEWIITHPELQPKKEWEKGTIETIKENPGVLLDPAYWAFVAAESASFTLAFLGTTILVTGATGNPFLGLLAGVAVTTPAQSQMLYEDLIASGATPEQAAQLSVPIGAVISSVEVVGALPILGTVSKPFRDILRRNIQREVVKQTLAELIKRGLITFTYIEVAEVMEEIVQGGIQDATVKTFDENRDLLANIPETAIRTAIATLPFALVGAGGRIQMERGVVPPTEVAPPTIPPEITPPVAPEAPITPPPTVPTPVTPKVTPPAVEVAKPLVEPVIPAELPTIPPPLPPEAVTLGRTENEWTGFMADLQEAKTVADVTFRDDVVRRWINLLPEIKGFFEVMNPSAIANTPAEQAIIIRAVLRDEGYQKTQGVIAFLNELGSQEKIFGSVMEKGLIKSGVLKGQTVGDIAEHRSRWEAKLTDEQKVWLDRAKVIEGSLIEFLEKNGIDITLLRLEEGGQFATRRVWARTLKDGSVIDTAYVGAGPGRPGARLPTEKHRMFKTEAEAIKAGYRYLPYEEALYLKLSGAYNRVADKQMADWLLTKVPWRTTGAPEELKLAAEAAILKKRHSQQLLSALNRAVRGERVPDITINSIATSYPDQAQRLKDLIPRIQAGEPTAKEVQSLTRVAKGLISSNKLTSQRAINARARAREKALVTRMGEAIIPAPAFAGKILTGLGAKETAAALRKAFDPSFSRALGEVNKINAVARYFMLAGDFSPFTIQLLFLAGENPITYGKTFAGAMRALFNPDFHSSYLLKHKATIDKHPNLLITKAGATEFTEAMARGGWLSGKTSLIPDAENYWRTLALILPRTLGKVGATVLTPFQRVFESALDIAGIEMAEAYDYLATTPERTADLDQFINEFRGLTSSARIGVDVLQRQRETGLVLAPRYNRAIAGLLYDLGRGGIRGSRARWSLAKGIAAISAIAALISIARGETPEEIVDHYNPNSPNFFTWDVAGQKVGPGTKVRSVIKLFAQSVDNPDSLFQFSMDNPGLRFLRGNLSPVVSSGLDLITGRSYIGDPTRDGMLSFSKEIIGGNLLPIWVQTVLMEGGDVKGRTVRGLVEFFGGRSYPEPVWGEVAKLRDKYAKQDFNLKYEDLNRMQTDKLRNNHPDLKDLEDKAQLEGAERGTEDEKWVSETIKSVTGQRDEALEKAATALLAGLDSNYGYDKERGYARPYYSGGMSVLWLAREHLDPYGIRQMNKWMGENQKPEDKAVDAYQEYRANLIQKADLPKDWDDIEAKSEAFLSRYSRSIRDYVKANLSRWINDLPENAREVELMRLAGIEDETWWDNYRGTRAPPTYTPKPPEEAPPREGRLGPNPFG